jgi:hypothetical protein
MSLTNSPDFRTWMGRPGGGHHIRSAAATQTAGPQTGPGGVLAAATGRGDGHPELPAHRARLLDGPAEMVKMMTAQRKTVGAMLGKNATVLPLGEYRGGARRTLYFTRPELNQLLGLYSRNVIRGIWRDYAIDHRDGQALFSIFRHTHESALYTIVKSAGNGGEAQFAVLSGRQRVRVARTLPEALDYFRSKLALVPGGRD